MSEWSGRAIAWFTLIIVLLTFVIVVCRYLFNSGWIMLQETVMYLYAWIFLLGIAYTLKHDEHVRVDIFYQKFSSQKKAWVNLLGTVFLIFPMVGFMFYSCWDYVLNSWEILEQSPDAGGLAFVYLLKSGIFVFCFLLLIEGIAQFFLALASILAKQDLNEEHDKKLSIDDFHKG